MYSMVKFFFLTAAANRWKKIHYFIFIFAEFNEREPNRKNITIAVKPYQNDLYWKKIYEKLNI